MEHFVLGIFQEHLAKVSASPPLPFSLSCCYGCLILSSLSTSTLVYRRLSQGASQRELTQWQGRD